MDVFLPARQTGGDMGHAAQSRGDVAADETGAKPCDGDADCRHDEERCEEPVDQRLRCDVRIFTDRFDLSAGRYRLFDDLLAVDIDAVRKVLPLCLRAARGLRRDHARAQFGELRIKLFYLRYDGGSDFDRLLLDPREVAIGLVEGILRGDEIVGIARNGEALDEQAAFADVGDHPFGHDRSGGYRHAFIAGLEREIATKARCDEAQQHDRDVGGRHRP